MNNLIIIRGPLGIGKTTISKILAQKLNANYFSVDEILSENDLDHIEEKYGRIPEENFSKVNDIIIKNVLERNKSFIVEGNFYYLNQIEKLVETIPYRPFIFTLVAPLEFCIERDSKREKPYGVKAATEVYKEVAWLSYGKIIDVSNLSIEQTVNLLYSNITENSL